MIKSIAVFLVSALLLMLFSYAAVTKISDFQKFEIQIGQSPLLTYFVDLVAISIPIVELLVASLLFFERTRLFGLYLSFTLMILFTTYIIDITRYAPYVPCACGGILGEMGWSQHLIFNIIVLAIILLAIIIAELPTHCPSKSSS